MNGVSVFAFVVGLLFVLAIAVATALLVRARDARARADERLEQEERWERQTQPARRDSGPLDETNHGIEVDELEVGGYDDLPGDRHIGDTQPTEIKRIVGRKRPKH